jgi:hypothetical protein
MCAEKNSEKWSWIGDTSNKTFGPKRMATVVHLPMTKVVIVTELMLIYPHMTTVLHNLYSTDCETTPSFAIWYVQGIHTGQLNPKHLLFGNTD